MKILREMYMKVKNTPFLKKTNNKENISFSKAFLLKENKSEFFPGVDMEFS